MLILESFQAGLSWECILNKREAFRKAYEQFNLNKVCNFDEDKVKAADVIIKFDSYEVEVEDLDSVKEVDIFEYEQHSKIKHHSHRQPAVSLK